MSAETTVRSAIEAFNSHDLDHTLTWYAESIVVHDPFVPEPQQGLDSMRSSDADFFRAFPDVQLELTNLVASDGSAAFQARMSGTHLGPLGGSDGEISPTGKRFEVEVAVFVRVEGERIAEEHRYYDTSNLMAQLGLLEA